jgi:hypothetical protein
MKNKVITLKKLLKLCKEYDFVKGKWPESVWEGMSVYEYIIEQINKEN